MRAMTDYERTDIRAWWESGDGLMGINNRFGRDASVGEGVSKGLFFHRGLLSCGHQNSGT